MLTGIVWIWSILTMITGLSNGLIALLIVRFLFGAGEAGALPNAIKSVERWFPAHARGSAMGIVLMAVRYRLQMLEEKVEATHAAAALQGDSR